MQNDQKKDDQKKDDQKKDDQKKDDRRKRALRGAIALSPAAAGVAVLIYAGAKPRASGSSFLSVLAVGLGAAGAALFAGILVGFVFGLPKIREEAVSREAMLATNTNLDKVSDWLTTILVGLGLVELGRASHGISSLGAALAPGLGSGPGAKSFGTALLIYSAVDGFLVGYIWTRIDLSARLHEAALDLNLRRRRAMAVAEEVPPPPEETA
jgi:hypothetical protein